MCILFFVFGDYQSGQRLPVCLNGEIRAGMEKTVFAKHLFSFTGDLDVLAAAGVQAEKNTSVCHIIFYATTDRITFCFPSNCGQV